MKKLILSAAATALAAGIFAAAKKADDPILMTVNGKDVKVSEFEYLFNKNNSQQMQPQSIDDYVGMFIDYKLKVADAEAAGIDTTAAFLKEFGSFRNELAAPYLKDSALEDSLLHQAYDHLCREVKVSHIMIAVDRNSPEGPARAKAELDSLRSAIVEGKARFEDIAAQHSIDSPTAAKGGLMGWITGGRFPWAFEEAAYKTPKGEISPVIDSGFGLHIVRVEDSREARGEVQASHILKLTRDMPEDRVAAQKASIDSIYRIVVAGADFADVATRESEDPGSARRGGDLGWFGSGMMVAEFDSVAFALSDGQISAPFKTAFGYHIIKRGGHKGIASFDEMHDKLMATLSRAGVADEPRLARLRELSDKYGASIDEAAIDALCSRISANNMRVDSVLAAALSSDKTPLATIGDEQITAAEAIAAMPVKEFVSDGQLHDSLTGATRDLLDNAVTRRAIDDLAVENKDYQNLINEYRDGILLFEISNRNVWDRASKDKSGLEKFFRDNASRYAWDKPRFKGYIIFASSDSVLAEATAYAETLPKSLPEQFVADMRKQFNRNIKIERVIAAKGDNPITDYIAFDGPKPDNGASRWTSYCAYQGRILNAPEEAADVRGAATTDYQALLEKQWLDELHKKYPVKVNDKILKKVKKSR